MKNQKITSDTKSPLGDRCPTRKNSCLFLLLSMMLYIMEYLLVRVGCPNCVPPRLLPTPSLLSVETEGKTEKVLMLCKPCSELVKTSVTNLKHSTIRASVKKTSSNKYIMIQFSICLFSWKSNRLTEHTKAICATSF